MADDYEIVDLGVDWVTATATTKASTNALWNSGMRWMIDEHKQGNDKRLWNFKGYDGFKSGAVAVGARPDSVIVRISGGLARQHFEEAFRVCTNISRLDQQVTVRSKRQAGKVISSCYRRALCKSRQSNRGPSVSILKHSNGSATLYLGQRISEKFGRVYDKGAESQLPVMQGAVRFEYEAKGSVALLEAKALAKSGNAPHHILERVSKFALDRIGRLEWMSAKTQTIVLHRAATDKERSLEWMRVGVRPTALRLAELGWAQEVLDCLGVDEIARYLPARLKRRA